MTAVETVGRHRPTEGRISMSSFLAGLAPDLATPAPWPLHQAKEPATNFPGNHAQEDAGGTPGAGTDSGEPAPRPGVPA